MIAAGEHVTQISGRIRFIASVNEVNQIIYVSRPCVCRLHMPCGMIDDKLLAVECIYQCAFPANKCCLPGPEDAIKEATEDCTCSELPTAGLTEGQPLRTKSEMEITGDCGASMIAAGWSSLTGGIELSH